MTYLPSLPEDAVLLHVFRVTADDSFFPTSANRLSTVGYEGLEELL
jgi:hypothetical protein